MMPRAGQPLTGRHVLLMLLGFFGVIVAVNGVMIYIAASSFTGVETGNAYVKGLAYNETLRVAETQKALGWRVELNQRSLGGGRWEMAALFRDKTGRPLDGLAVTAELRRPVHEGADRTVPLVSLGEGRYGAEIALPLKGQWDARLSATAPGGEIYLMEQRLWLK